MIVKKKTMREFDVAYNEYTAWPLEMSYNVYSDLVDDINKALEERNEKVCNCNPVDNTVDAE